MLALILALPVVLPVLALSPPPAVCDNVRVQSEFAALIHEHRYADAHQLAFEASIWCETDATSPWRLSDAVALFLLNDAPAATQLALSVASAPSPALATRANVIRGWMAWRTRDESAMQQSITRLPPEARAGLCLAMRADELPPPPACPLATPDVAIDAATTSYRVARATRRPWLAGVLSGVLPGAGQVYAGSWQGAAVTFALNAVSIAATVELARDRLYFSSALTGLAASIFYVGGIVNAADLAAHRNDIASDGPREQLESLLFPERLAAPAPQ